MNEKILISGPCSAESYNQVINTSKALKKFKIDYFRAGIWKPRTRPNSFEGVGEKGLKWLKEAQKITGIIPITEVATPKHIELCLKHNINSMWIGARTTSNPFSITEIYKSLKGVKANIGIKNPISSDINLWIGAIERIQKNTDSSIFCIHRGFYSNNSKYRNEPIWDIPLKLKKIFPEIKIICDPSHICGNTKLIFDVSQRALDLSFDGFMIECHIDPTSALTDKNQQLTPIQLENILNQLVVKHCKSDNKNYNENIKELRHQIDLLDYKLINILEKRMNISTKIGKEKKNEKISIFQQDRWKRIIEDRTSYGLNKGLSVSMIEDVFESIHKESIKKQ